MEVSSGNIVKKKRKMGKSICCDVYALPMGEKYKYMYLVTLERQMAKLKEKKKGCFLCDRKGAKGRGHNLDFSKYALIYRFDFVAIETLRYL